MKRLMTKWRNLRTKKMQRRNQNWRKSKRKSPRNVPVQFLDLGHGRGVKVSRARAIEAVEENIAQAQLGHGRGAKVSRARAIEAVAENIAPARAQQERVKVDEAEAEEVGVGVGGAEVEAGVVVGAVGAEVATAADGAGAEIGGEGDDPRAGAGAGAEDADPVTDDGQEHDQDPPTGTMAATATSPTRLS